MFLQIRRACKKAKTLNLEAFNYSDTSIDWDNNGAEMKARDRLVAEGQDCFFKQFIELSTWSRAIPALILGNRRNLGGVKMQ